MTAEYNPNIPSGPKSFIGPDQVNFLNNFSSLFSSFSVNHVSLNAISGAGNHTIIQLLEQSEQLQTDTGEISIYSKFVEGQTDQIFLRFQGNQKEFQFSTYQLYQLKDINEQTQFFTFLPGSIIVYFGFIQAKITHRSKKNLLLYPAVAKNIITMNFCPFGTSTSYSPSTYVYQPDDNGIYSKILLQGSVVPEPSFVPTTYFYIVLANI